MARSWSHLHLEAGGLAGSQKENANHTMRGIFGIEIDMRYAPASIPKMAITHGNVQKCMYRISCPLCQLIVCQTERCNSSAGTAAVVAAAWFPSTFLSCSLCLPDVIWRRNLFSASSVIKHCQMQQVASVSGALLLLPLPICPARDQL